MATAVKKIKRRPKSYFIHAIIGIAVMFCFGLIPAAEPLTPLGMSVIGIFLGSTYLLAFCEVTWPSILCLIALALFGYKPIGQIIAGSMGHTVVYQSIMAYIVTGCLQHYGVAEFIARWILSRPKFCGKPKLFMFVFFMVFNVIAMFVSSLAIVILGWAILYSMLDLMGYKKHEAFSNMAVVGVVLAFEAGGAIVPFKGWQLGLANQFSEVVGMPINYVTFMVVGFIISTLTLLVYLLVVSKVFKVDFSRLATFDVTALDNADKKMDTRQKIVLWINGAVMFFILLASLLPSGTGIYKFFNSTLTVAGIFSLGAILMSIISLKDGEPLIDFHAVASTSVRWDVLFRIGSAMVLAAAFVAPETGIMDWCGIVFAPIFSGKSSYVFLLIIILITGVFTNVCNNIALGAMLIPVVAPFIQASGANPMLVGITLIYVVNMAMILPSGAAPTALMHANSDWLIPSDAYKYATWAEIISLGCAIPIIMIANAIMS